MAVDGVVRVWHTGEGWGAIVSRDTPGGCWAGFPSVLVPGYWTLHAGQSVMLEYEPAEQDGHSFRAIEVWPADQEPFREGETPDVSDAYRSALTITMDDSDEAESGLD